MKVTNKSISLREKMGFSRVEISKQINIETSKQLIDLRTQEKMGLKRKSGYYFYVSQNILFPLLRMKFLESLPFFSMNSS